MATLRSAVLRRARPTAIVGAVLLAGVASTQSSARSSEPVAIVASGPSTDAPIVGSAPDNPIDLVAVLDATGAGGGSPDNLTDTGRALFEISAEGGYGLPKAASRAYHRAARTIELTHPGCDLPWGLLAGIGRVESDHGRFGRSRLGKDGVSRPLIRGIALDGVGPVAAIADSDNGRLDDDAVWDRAVGPMQFIPTTWAGAGADGDGDGVENPDDLDDAALAAAGYLCPESGPIGDEAAMRLALFSYNHSDYYVDLVYAFALGYQTGVFDIPPPPVEPDPDVDAPTRPGKRGAKGPGDTVDAPTPAEPSATPSSPDPAPAAPTRPPKAPHPPKPPEQPVPQPTPTPTPAPLVLKSGTGPWSTCGAGWCLSGYSLDLGPVSQALQPAADDFDGDGLVETNRGEFDGLVGSSVTIEAERGTAVVYTINGLGFRNADGSFAS